MIIRILITIDNKSLKLKLKNLIIISVIQFHLSVIVKKFMKVIFSLLHSSSIVIPVEKVSHELCLQG